jgi:lipoprotein-anchoring transpeptidase ErfK/SrfK
MGMRVRGRLTGLGVTAAAVTAIATVSGMTGASASVAKPLEIAKPATAAAVTAPAWTAPKQTLREGETGAAVKSLQERLNSLKYYAGPDDGKFGNDTLEAVWAFQEVNHLTVNGVVGSVTQRFLEHPRSYTPNDPHKVADRVEVNLGLGVLVLYINHEIALISHVSTGGHYYFNGGDYAKTPTGRFHALYYVSGWDQGPLGAMYNPTFFNYDGDAIHGDTAVPLAPVSHGCVRLPMDVAAFFHKYLHITEKPGAGTEIWIYDQWNKWTQ